MTANWLQAAGKWLGPLNAAEVIHGIPHNLLVRIAYQESHFRQDIINGATKSSVGAVGIMQLMPKNFPGAGKNPMNDIAMAATFLARLYKVFKDWQIAVASYDWGEGDVEHSFAKNADKYVLSQMPPETQKYVREVFADVPLPGVLLAQPPVSGHTPPAVAATLKETPVNTTTVGAIPWYKSPVQISQVTAFISALIAIFPKLGTLLGVKTADDVTNLVTPIFGAIAVIAPLIGTILRARSQIQPLTITQSNADNHPATATAAENAQTIAQSQIPLDAAASAAVSTQTPISGKPWGK